MTNAEILLKAFRGKAAIRERQKQMTKEHTERWKRLDRVINDIDKADSTSQMSISGMESIVVSPEVADLLENPTHGL